MSRVKSTRTLIGNGGIAKQSANFNSLIQQLETPRSFLNIIPDMVRIAALGLDESYLTMDDEQLTALILEKTNAPIPAIVDALRNNFWLEFARCSATKYEIMQNANIYLGVCGLHMYEDIILQRPHMVAYIITQPPEYEAVMGGLMSLSVRRIRDFLNIPLKKPNGEYQDAKTLELVLKAAAMVDLRVQGGYTMRSETKNLTMINQKTEVSNTYSAVFDNAGGRNANQLSDDIDAQLKRLDAELAAQPQLPPAAPRFTTPGNPEPQERKFSEPEVLEKESGEQF